MRNEFIDQIAWLSDNTRTRVNRVESSQFSILIMNSMKTIVAKLLSKLNKYLSNILSIDSKIDQNDEEEMRVQGFPKITRHAAC